MQKHNWLTEYNLMAGHGAVVEHFDIYLVALYWSAMTMSTIGYGDVAPQTRIERVYVIGGIFLGASLYAYMVGAVCGIVAAMDPDESDFYGAMDTCGLPFRVSSSIVRWRCAMADLCLCWQPCFALLSMHSGHTAAQCHTAG